MTLRIAKSLIENEGYTAREASIMVGIPYRRMLAQLERHTDGSAINQGECRSGRTSEEEFALIEKAVSARVRESKKPASLSRHGQPWPEDSALSGAALDADGQYIPLYKRLGKRGSVTLAR